MTTEHEAEGAEGATAEEQSAAPPRSENEAARDAAALVDQMVAAGEWPHPDLLQQILDQGEAAVGPLVDVVKTRPLGWPQEALLDNAVGLLSMLKSPTALPALREAARFYKNDTAPQLADAIALHGQAGLDALIELIRDPAVSGYLRSDLIHGAKKAAGTDPALRSRLADAVRTVFEEVVAEARKDKQFENELLSAGKEDEGIGEDRDLHGQPIEEPDEDRFNWLTQEDVAGQPIKNEAANNPEQEMLRKMESDNELPRDEDLAFLANDLADLADFEARDLVLTACDEGLIDEEIVKKEEIEEAYDEGGQCFLLPEPWLEEYRESYRLKLEDDERQARMPNIEFPTRVSYPPPEPARTEPPPVPVETFRRAAPKIGRNDPCWCGSGKKYKKCHLGKDRPV
ncbi:MAG: SEC-C metal-binding domain-containing protein [Isosphaeraceae bacterium]